ncbi:MAG: dTDP-4-amino-4,6-dideoxygalactose transaminase [Chlamydiales bacterium]
MLKEIPYLDLSVKDTKLKAELLDAVNRVLTHGRLILGPEVIELEHSIASYCGRKHAVGVSSGSDALSLALTSLGIGPGDEVITTPMSWIATANAITLCGAKPVFVDVSEDFNINPDLIPAAITSRTKAILPVHYTGKVCDMPKIMDIAKAHNLFVIEDAAQAFGSTHKGAMAGSFGDIACFSMNAMKVFNAFGDAGAVVCNDDELNKKLTILRYAGTVDKEDCHYPSSNSRMDTIQAAMLLVNLKGLGDKIAKRRRIASQYSESLKNLVTCPYDDSDSLHTYYTYTIICEERDELKRFLQSKAIECKIRHPILMPQHKAYQRFSTPPLPIAEYLVKQILCLPNHENLSPNEVETISSYIKEFYDAR